MKAVVTILIIKTINMTSAPAFLFPEAFPRAIAMGIGLGIVTREDLVRRDLGC